MITFIPGHKGTNIDIEDDEDAIYAIQVIYHQIEKLDKGHPLLEPLEKILEEFE